MTCETRQEQVSLLCDGELVEPDQVALFGHLETCADCRLYLDSMIRLRRAVRIDREEVSLLADEALPPWSAIPSPRRRPVPRAGSWLPRLAGGWRVPAPVAVGMAVLLLAAGALVGSRVAAVSGDAGGMWRTKGTAAQTVVVVCSLPEVQVLSTQPRL